jgi:methylmalonyl-CoA mutase C-terminal domain/subunit
MVLVPRVIDLLRSNQQDNVKVFIGGIIPDSDIPELLQAGVMAVYGPGTSSETYIRDIRQAFLSE